MDCTESRSRLHAYLDQELDLPASVALERHLASCADCSALYARQSALKQAVRRHAEYHAAPAGLADRIRARVGRGAAAAAPAAAPAAVFAPRAGAARFGRWLRFGAALAATAVVSWMAGSQYGAPGGGEMLAEQVIASHARAVLTERLVDVASSDQHTVKPWLSSKLDFSPPVSDLADAGFPLLGGRLDYLDSRPVAALVYRHRQHVINLFIWPESKPAPVLSGHSASRHGYHVVSWREDGMAFWAISDLNPAEMKTFAETCRKAYR